MGKPAFEYSCTVDIVRLIRLVFVSIPPQQLQDVAEKEHMRGLQRPPSRDDDKQSAMGPVPGFVVKNAPWDRAPDTESQEEFPSFGATVQPKGTPWGPIRK